MLRAFNTLYAEYEIIKNLKFKTTFSYDYTTVKGEKWYDPRTSNGEDENGGSKTQKNSTKKMVWSNTLSYLTTFNNIHHFDAFLPDMKLMIPTMTIYQGKQQFRSQTNMPLVME